MSDDVCKNCKYMEEVSGLAHFWICVKEDEIKPTAPGLWCPLYEKNLGD